MGASLPRCQVSTHVNTSHLEPWRSVITYKMLERRSSQPVRGISGAVPGWVRGGMLSMLDTRPVEVPGTPGIREHKRVCHMVGG